MPEQGTDATTGIPAIWAPATARREAVRGAGLRLLRVLWLAVSTIVLD